MIKRLMPLMLATVSLCQIGAAATPSADLIKKITTASGGTEAFQALGVIRMEITEKDTLQDGTSQSSSFTATVDTSFNNIRLEMENGQIIIVSNGDTGWALVQGKLDERRQTAHMAPKVVRKKIMPWLLPFSLNLNGVYFPEKPSAATFDGKAALTAAFTVPGTFFDTPAVNTTWTAHLTKGNNRLLAAGFLPAEGYNEAGMLFRIKTTAEINGVQFPSFIEVNRLDATGKKTPGKRTITIKSSIVDEPSPALFLHPERLRAIEEDE